MIDNLELSLVTGGWSREGEDGRSNLKNDFGLENNNGVVVSSLHTTGGGATGFLI